MQFVHENSYVLRSMVSPSLTLSVSSVLHSLYLRCTLLTGNSSRLPEPLPLHSLPPCPGAGRPLAPAWPSCWPSWPRQTAVGRGGAARASGAGQSWTTSGQGGSRSAIQRALAQLRR